MTTNINKILIVGHKGAMGAYFFNKLGSLDNMEVLGIDKPLQKTELRAITKDISIVLFCIPVHAMDTVVSQIVHYINQDTIMVDICSVKVIPLNIMLKNYPGPVVGTHPLFGPSPDPNSLLKIAMVKGRGDNEFNIIKKLFDLAGFYTFECSAKEHDQAMAFIQALNFVTTLSYFATVSEDESLLKFITPSFERRFNSAKKMLTQDAYLFQTLFESNPFSHDAVKKFRSFLNLASAGDIDLLIQKAWWWWKNGLNGEDEP